VAVVGNLVSYLRAKLESKSVTPDTTFRFNSKDVQQEMEKLILWHQVAVFEIPKVDSV
jgi:hypothetical protein